MAGTVTNAVSSNPELFSVVEEDGTWSVSANQAFSSNEWLRVTIDGVEYEVVVTDAQVTRLNTKYTSNKYLSTGTYELQGNTTISGQFVLKLHQIMTSH